MAPKIEIVFNKSPSQPTYEPGENITGYVVVTISNKVKAQGKYRRFCEFVKMCCQPAHTLSEDRI